MTYTEAAEYILNIPKFTKKNSLKHTRTFLSYLGEPQNGLKVIHVAGTNGKGSVCKYLDAMLRAEGKTTGMFVSPHLVHINERISVNGAFVSDEEFLELFEITLKQVRRMEEDGLPHPTFFEFLFGMAVLEFARSGVEYAVLETGLGGRLDATNSISRPLACVITSIGLDHTAILGDTIEAIAGEKAGIIKDQVPVIFADTQKESNLVIERTASEHGCCCKKIGNDAYEILGIEDKHIAFSISNAYYGDTTWKLRNIGIYQAQNAVLAAETMRMLFGSAGHPSRWRAALSELVWEGRMEEILPGFYVDGAHNVSAIEQFIRSVSMKKERCILLFSAVKEKQYEEMIARICRGVDADFYMVTLIDDVRAARTEELKAIFDKYTDRPVEIRDSLRDALEYILAHREGRTVYCIGSLYLTGMIKSIIQEVA